MERPVKFLIGGVIAGLLTFGSGYAGSKYYENELRGLIQSCEAESDRSRANAKDEVGKVFKMVCEPNSLSSLGDLVGIQSRIVETHRKAQTWSESSRLLAILIVVISAVPFIWYFLLRRVRELREAIMGK
jgi:hypothetical protein